ncbi:transposase [Streptomyces sp. ISL-100]|nr:transposase [Streptomyces sp. ISL-100]
MAGLRVPQGRGRPRTRPEAVLADKAYSSRAIREHLRRRGIRAVIAVPADQCGHRLRRGSRGGRPASPRAGGRSPIRSVRSAQFQAEFLLQHSGLFGRGENEVSLVVGVPEAHELHHVKPARVVARVGVDVVDELHDRQVVEVVVRRVLGLLGHQDAVARKLQDLAVHLVLTQPDVGDGDRAIGECRGLLQDARIALLQIVDIVPVS